ncbi:hypothetical protein BDZ89DRAFT_1078564 [Hymenopellis radicata]|nr:hypothetical protein BDZ89DRAFT_1078564 [Hymenopellis radicata]
MPTSGDELLERIAIAYQYASPQRGLCTSHATAPTNALNLEAAQASCETQLILKIAKEDFADRVLRTEGDVTSVANEISNCAKFFIKQAYSRQRLVDIQAQYLLADQRPDRLVSLGDSGFVGEDKSWLAFEHGAGKIIDIAQSEAGRQLKRWAKEEHGRAMLYKLAVAMFDTKRYWGFLFGGDGALLFQCCKSEEPTRYGILCSGLLTIERLFVTTLGMLLVPGDTPLVDLAKLHDTVKTLHVWFSMPGYEFMTLQLYPVGVHPKGLENHFTQEVALPLSRQLPLVATPPVLVNERMGPGATGVFGGEADLRHEHHVYSLLASLQGREGWTALMIEHCGDKVSDGDTGQHAHEIHANGIRHTDLELRNLIVSTSGDLRIVDFAYSEVGHECEGGMCRELSYFRTLLKLP